MAVTDKPQSFLSILSLELIAYSWHPVQALPVRQARFQLCYSDQGSFHLKAVLPSTYVSQVTLQDHLHSAGRRTYHRRSYLVGFYGRFFLYIGLKVVHIISTYIPLAKIQSFDHIQLQGTLGRVFQLLFWKEKHRQALSQQSIQIK